MTEPLRPIDPAAHRDRRNLVESVLNWIPGFHGYLQKEYRRESDHLARTWLADRLQRAKRPLDEYLHTLVADGRLDDLPQFERLRTRLDGLISKLRGDVRGYSGFFDYVRVDEEKLDDVYELDMSLIEEAEAIGRSIEKLSANEQSPSSAAADLLRQTDELEQRYARRGELLKGLSE